MKTPLLKNRVRGLTLFEMLLVTTVLAVLATLFLPALTRPRHHSHGISCVNDLKQVGLAFRVWEGDNNDKYPMAVSNKLGGTLEWVPDGNAFRHFQVMSNELSTPKILVCSLPPQ